MNKSIHVSTPGRICLFGEHQDYLGLPVIAAAISRRVDIEGTNRNDGKAIIHLPDIAKKNIIEIIPEMPYVRKRDYFRSALNILQRMGYSFSRGVECTVKGNIPINSGTSSSSALLISWIHFLTKMADNPKPLSAETMAEIGYHAEVTEFNEAGGMMDHYSTAVGDVIYLESVPKIKLSSLKPNLGTFVLGDSQEAKDTVGLIKRVKGGVLGAIEKIKIENSDFLLSKVNISELDNYSKILTLQEFELLEGNISNREILKEALKLFSSPTFEDNQLGELLNLHQDNLRDKLKISTPKIDRMISASLEAGALGGKINGSGGGGCMFVYAPHNPQKVAQAIEYQGGKAYIVCIDGGTSLSAKVER